MWIFRNYYEWESMNENVALGKNKTSDLYPKYVNREKSLNGLPLIGSQWHQHMPYNMFRNKEYEDKYPAGCGTIALGQVAWYFRHEKEIQEKLPYINKIAASYQENGGNKSLIGAIGKKKIIVSNGLYSRTYVEEFPEIKGGEKEPLSGSVEERMGKRLDEVYLKETLSALDNYLKNVKKSETGTSSNITDNSVSGLFQEIRNELFQIKEPSWNTIAKRLYEAIVVNNIPVIVGLGYKANSYLKEAVSYVTDWDWDLGGHWCIVDGVNVDRDMLEKTHDFSKACKFHWNFGWKSYDKGNSTNCETLVQKKKQWYLENTALSETDAEQAARRDVYNQTNQLKSSYFLISEMFILTKYERFGKLFFFSPRKHYQWIETSFDKINSDNIDTKIAGQQELRDTYVTGFTTRISRAVSASKKISIEEYPIKDYNFINPYKYDSNYNPTNKKFNFSISEVIKVTNRDGTIRPGLYAVVDTYEVEGRKTYHVMPLDKFDGEQGNIKTHDWVYECQLLKRVPKTMYCMCVNTTRFGHEIQNELLYFKRKVVGEKAYNKATCQILFEHQTANDYAIIDSIDKYGRATIRYAVSSSDPKRTEKLIVDNWVWIQSFNPNGHAYRKGIDILVYDFDHNIRFITKAGESLWANNTDGSPFIRDIIVEFPDGVSRQVSESVCFKKLNTANLVLYY